MSTTCAGTTQSGSPCSNPPMEGSAYCHLHQDQAGGGGGERPQHPARRFLRLVSVVVAVMFLAVVAVRCGAG